MIATRMALLALVTLAGCMMSEPAPTPVPQTGSAVARDGCFIGGCSDELCSDRDDVVSSCIWNPQYVCYRGATCERQVSGACGWTATLALEACLADPPPSP